MIGISVYGLQKEITRDTFISMVLPVYIFDNLLKSIITLCEGCTRYVKVDLFLSKFLDVM